MNVFIKYRSSIYTKHCSLDHVNGRDPNQGLVEKFDKVIFINPRFGISMGN